MVSLFSTLHFMLSFFFFKYYGKAEKTPHIRSHDYPLKKKEPKRVFGNVLKYAPQFSGPVRYLGCGNLEEVTSLILPADEVIRHQGEGRL